MPVGGSPAPVPSIIEVQTMGNDMIQSNTTQKIYVIDIVSYRVDDNDKKYLDIKLDGHNIINTTIDNRTLTFDFDYTIQQADVYVYSGTEMVNDEVITNFFEKSDFIVSLTEQSPYYKFNTPIRSSFLGYRLYIARRNS